MRFCFCSIFGVFAGKTYATEYAGVDLAKTVSGGAYHAAAVKPDGSLWIWGNNGSFQLGVDNEDPSYNAFSPERVFEGGIAMVSLGGFHSMAITEDGELYGWGQNTSGQLGLGDYANKATPFLVMESVAAVSSGFQHTLAIKRMERFGRGVKTTMVSLAPANGIPSIRLRRLWKMLFLSPRAPTTILH